MSKTQDFRDECERRGIEYTCGLVMGETKKRVNTENVTTLWDGEHADRSLTFEEDESGVLWCADEMSVSQCIGAYLAGLERDDD